MPQLGRMAAAGRPQVLAAVLKALPSTPLRWFGALAAGQPAFLRLVSPAPIQHKLDLG